MKNKIIALGAGSWLRINLTAMGIGLMVGLCINLIFIVFLKKGYDYNQFIYTIVFSIMITLSITNVVSLFQKLTVSGNRSFWVFVAGYYLSNLAGMVIGTEISFIIVELIRFGKPAFRLHPWEYSTNSVIVLIVGTILLLYNMQLSRSQEQISAKDSDLAKLRQLQTETELQALQSRINPHFLYNSLNSIASLIHEDADKAEQMTVALSKLFRYSINSAKENLHLLKDEIDILRTYLAIEQVRFGDRMRFEILVDPGLENLKVPRFLVQPLVENAIKHGLNNMATNAEIRIVVQKLAERIRIAVYDNGTPFPENIGMGYGMQSTFDKLKLLYQDDYDVQLINEPKHINLSFPVLS